MNYKEIYCFEVIEEAKKGKSVFVVDKREGKIFNLNILELEKVLSYIFTAENDKTNRLSFYVEEKIVEDANNEAI